jgi:hypothetical protein
MSSLSRLSAQARAAIQRALNAFRAGRRVERPDDGARVVPPPVQERYDEIELSGRDASYDRDGIEAVYAQSEVRIVRSSNVYSYAWENESANQVILYVTFLFWAPGTSAAERHGPGSTYAYYDVPRSKLNEFAGMADSSAGTAVWDYLRVRGTTYGHQHRYRLIQASGDYVPRKATQLGFKKRQLSGTGFTASERKFAGKMTWTGTDKNDKDPQRTFAHSFLPDRSFRNVNRGRAPNGRRPPNRG